MLGSNKQLFGNILEENLGSVQFTLSFDQDTSLLTINLIQASELTVADAAAGTTNPFIRLRLLPDVRNHVQTKMHTGTLCPIFDESFIFEANSSNLSSRTLEISVFHGCSGVGDPNGNGSSKKQGLGGSAASGGVIVPPQSTICIGQILAPLDPVDLREPVTMWKGISAYEKKSEVRRILSHLLHCILTMVALWKFKCRRAVMELQNHQESQNCHFVLVFWCDGNKRKCCTTTGNCRRGVTGFMSASFQWASFVTAALISSPSLFYIRCPKWGQLSITGSWSECCTGSGLNHQPQITRDWRPSVERTCNVKQSII